MKKIFILTGEASGDKLASKVISDLKKINQNIEYLSVGGEHLQSLGIKSIYNLKEITVSSNKSLSLGITFAQKCQAITNLCKSKCGFDPNHKYTKNNRQKLMRYIKEYERIGLNQFIKNHKKKNYLEK